MKHLRKWRMPTEKSVSCSLKVQRQQIRPTSFGYLLCLLITGRYAEVDNYGEREEPPNNGHLKRGQPLNEGQSLYIHSIQNNLRKRTLQGWVPSVSIVRGSQVCPLFGGPKCVHCSGVPSVSIVRGSQVCPLFGGPKCVHCSGVPSVSIVRGSQVCPLFGGPKCVHCSGVPSVSIVRGSQVCPLFGGPKCVHCSGVPSVSIVRGSQVCPLFGGPKCVHCSEVPLWLIFK